MDTKKENNNQKGPEVTSKEQSELIVISTDDLTPTEIAVQALVDAGLQNTVIGKTLDIHSTYASKIRSKLQKYDLVTPKMGKLARTAVQSLVQGKGVGDVDKVKDSTVLAAAQMFYDRAFPIVSHNVNLNANLDFEIVSADRWRDK
jgi:hypothetical protein